jgi:hypothetical protein
MFAMTPAPGGLRTVLHWPERDEDAKGADDVGMSKSGFSYIM